MIRHACRAKNRFGHDTREVSGLARGVYEAKKPGPQHYLPRIIPASIALTKQNRERTYDESDNYQEDASAPMTSSHMCWPEINRLEGSVAQHYPIFNARHGTEAFTKVPLRDGGACVTGHSLKTE